MSRAEKVAEEIRREVSQIVQEDLRDPRLGFITVTRVELTPDLRFARIFFSVYGDEKQWQGTQEGLDHAVGFIRRLIGERLDLRYVPEIVFKEDHSSEYGILIEQQIEKIKEEKSSETKNRKAAHGAKKTVSRTKKKKK
jgi:ribosome-binding factor A